MKLKWFVALLLLTMAMTACDDTTDTIGMSLTDNMDNLKLSTDSFRLTTRSIMADSVLSRNVTGYLGRVKDPETGAYVTGNFMVQFHTLENFGLNEMPDRENVACINDEGEFVADSCDIRLYFTNQYGDSLTAMKMTAHEMDTPMKEDVSYYSNFNPLSEGLVRQEGIHTDLMYSLTNMNYSDTQRASSTFSKHIRIPLNEPYTDKEGKTYNNYGSYLLNAYYNHPEYFNNSYQFIHNVCPGFFMETKEGLGAMAYISSSQLNVYFRYKTRIGTDTTETDTIYSGFTAFGGTEEVMQTTTIENDREVLQRLVEDNSCTYLKTPAGIFTEITLPVDEISNRHVNDTLSQAKIVLRQINDTYDGEYTFNVPQRLLMVERDSMYTFFEQSKIPDYRQSFLSDSESTSYGNTFTFSNVSNLVRHMLEQKEAGLKSNPNWLAEHPNWNKVMIIPVSLTTNTSTYSTTVVKVSHDMSLCSTRLVGGSENPYDDILITVIYSKFSGK